MQTSYIGKSENPEHKKLLAEFEKGCKSRQIETEMLWKLLVLATANASLVPRLSRNANMYRHACTTSMFAFPSV